MKLHPTPMRLFTSRVGDFDTRRFVRTASRRVASVLGAALLISCGGGGDSGSAAPATTAPPPAAGGGTTAPAPPAVGAAITEFKIQNTGAAQTNVPFTIGQVIAPGQMSSSEGLAATLADGSVVRLQSDIKATHADGSVRHVIISGILPSLAAGATQTLKLVKSSASERSAESLQTLAASGLTGKVTITVGGSQYTATLADALAEATPETWLSGQVANEWLLDAPLKNAAGATHPQLTTRFYVRWYSGLTRQARVDVVVENVKTFTAGRTLTYDVNVEIGGRSVYSKTALTHYHHARWHKTAWWDASREPAVNIQHNSAYLMASRAVSNYDASVVPSERALAALGRDINAANTGPMTIGPLVAYMPTSGGRGDIGPLPSWSVMYLLSMDQRARNAMMAAADGSGTWSMHYRDEGTGYPVRTDNAANRLISTHGNLASEGPLPVPRCASGATCQTPYEEDVAHQPSLAYLPYLVTGDFYYLEELQFWAAFNPLATAPGNNGNGQGLVRWQQLRGQAWSLRTLAHSAYITPDNNPLKAYFNTQLDNNLEFYNAAYVVGNPNNLGMYDGSGPGAFTVDTSAPWQDDFLTWSFGYIAELGYSKAAPILRWKAKYPVGRMGPEYCWIQGAAYSLGMRGSDGRVFNSFDSLYRANFGGTTLLNDNSQPFTHPRGLRFIDQPCGSQAQADFLGLANGFGWAVGRMTGYADSTVGYPANMQPALAVSATTGIPNASQAWTTFANRAAKPDYTQEPQWAIVPR